MKKKHTAKKHSKKGGSVNKKVKGVGMIPAPSGAAAVNTQ